MPKSDPSKLEALDALLAERRKHEGYLAKLEERRAATPEHVFTRLRDEYLTKLTDLHVRAAAEAEALVIGVEEEQAAVAEIDARLALVEEERIEGQLRADVGEYDAKDWGKKLTVLTATIAQLEKERDAKAAAYERTMALVIEARAGGAGGEAADESPVAPEPASAPPPMVESASAPRPIAEPRTGPSAPPPAEAPRRAPDIAGSPSFDELAFLNSVVGRSSTPVPIPAPAPVPRASRTVPAESEAPSAPPVSRAPVAPRAAPPAPPAAAPIVERVSAPPPVIEKPSAPAPAAQSPVADDSADTEPIDEPPSALGRPTPRTSQAIKTLKCQECGTFNYPTEWYCERCGGELAAL